jgi:hypothetical protein
VPFFILLLGVLMKKIVNLNLIVLVFLLTGCADNLTFAQAMVTEPVGFWYGFWHGWILPFAWVWSLFDSDTTIYAIYNNHGWYNFGFFLGVGPITIATAKARRKRKKVNIQK